MCATPAGRRQAAPNLAKINGKPCPLCNGTGLVPGKPGRPKRIVYGLVDPRDGLVYYVGQSKTGLRRAYRHASPSQLAKDAGTPKVAWIESLLAAGMDPEGLVLEEVHDETMLLERERYWIAHWRVRNPRLTNCESLRGRPRGPVSKQQRRRLSRRSKERWADPEFKAAISAKLKGRKFSPETIQRMREGQRRRMQDGAQRSKFYEAGAAGRADRDYSAADYRLRLARACGARPFVDQFGVRYESIRGASRQLGIDSSQISRVLNGKSKKTRGYVFAYVDEGAAGGPPSTLADNLVDAMTDLR